MLGLHIEFIRERQYVWNVSPATIRRQARELRPLLQRVATNLGQHANDRVRSGSSFHVLAVMYFVFDAKWFLRLTILPALLHD
jgi:hypothetical protein